MGPESVTFLNVDNNYVAEEEDAEATRKDRIYKYYHSGKRRGKHEVIHLPGKNIHMLCAMPSKSLYIAFDENYDICLHQDNQIIIIDQHHGFFYFKGMSARGSCLAYQTTDKSFKIIPDLEFKKLKDQELVYSIEVGVFKRIKSHKILGDNRIIVLGEDGFLGLYTFSGELLFRVDINFQKMSCLDVMESLNLIAVTGTPEYGIQSAVVFKLTRNKLKRIRQWRVKCFSALMDVCFQLTTDEKKEPVVLTQACRAPFRLFRFNVYSQEGLNTEEIDSRVLEIDCKYKWAHQVIFDPESKILVTGGKSIYLNVIKFGESGGEMSEIQEYVEYDCEEVGEHDEGDCKIRAVDSGLSGLRVELGAPRKGRASSGSIGPAGAGKMFQFRNLPSKDLELEMMSGMEDFESFSEEDIDEYEQLFEECQKLEMEIRREFSAEIEHMETSPPCRPSEPLMMDEPDLPDEMDDLDEPGRPLSIDDGSGGEDGDEPLRFHIEGGLGVVEGLGGLGSPASDSEGSVMNEPGMEMIDEAEKVDANQDADQDTPNQSVDEDGH